MRDESERLQTILREIEEAKRQQTASPDESVERDDGLV